MTATTTLVPRGSRSKSATASGVRCSWCLARSSSPDTSMGSVSSRDTVDLGGTCLRTFCAPARMLESGVYLQGFPPNGDGGRKPPPRACSRPTRRGERTPRLGWALGDRRRLLVLGELDEHLADCNPERTRGVPAGAGRSPEQTAGVGRARWMILASAGAVCAWGCSRWSRDSARTIQSSPSQSSQSGSRWPLCSSRWRRSPSAPTASCVEGRRTPRRSRCLPPSTRGWRGLRRSARPMMAGSMNHQRDGLLGELEVGRP